MTKIMTRHDVNLCASLLVARPCAVPAAVQGRVSSAKVSHCRIALTALVLDGLGLCAGSLTIIAFDKIWPVGSAPRLNVTLALAVLLSLAMLHIGGFYQQRLQSSEFSAKAALPVAPAAAASFVVVAAIGYGAPSDGILPWIFSWWATATAGLLAGRTTFMALCTNWAASGRLSERIAIIGTGRAARRSAQLLRHASARADVVGIFVNPIRQKSTATETQERAFEELAALAHTGGIDRVVLALPLSDADGIAALIRLIQALPVEIGIGWDEPALPCSFRGGRRIGQLLVMDVLERPLDDWKWLLKTLEDKVLAIVILGCLFPLLFAIAVAIKLDSPGPVLFWQKRYGYGNRVFEMLKFRSMRIECADPLGECPTKRNDPRLTRVGEFIRRTSVDELPQLINVLLGQMSIVGPRPHAVSDPLFKDTGDHYGLRHRIKPGITGWAQVNGWRGAINALDELHKRLEHDLYYMETWSLSLDLKIILRTVGLVCRPWRRPRA
jgi:Undecaprenyl-phosphate glucose phosphotransferase